jgi:hypothetical protein
MTMYTCIQEGHLQRWGYNPQLATFCFQVWTALQGPEMVIGPDGTFEFQEVAGGTEYLIAEGGTTPHEIATVGQLQVALQPWGGLTDGWMHHLLDEQYTVHRQDRIVGPADRMIQNRLHPWIDRMLGKLGTGLKTLVAH